MGRGKEGGSGEKREEPQSTPSRSSSARCVFTFLSCSFFPLFGSILPIHEGWEVTSGSFQRLRLTKKLRWEAWKKEELASNRGQIRRVVGPFSFSPFLVVG